MSLPDCTCGHVGDPIEYHDGPECARFLAWRTEVKVARLERVRADVIDKLAKGESKANLAALYQTQTRILDAFETKHQAEIDEAKNPAPQTGGGTRP